ncbi:MAG: 3'(2'),5'-bisphosphate nucleotidase CysQ [Pseudomonadota bacterium]
MQAPELTAANQWQKQHALLCNAVREAGELALRMANAGVGSWDKKDGSPVSEADLAVDQMLAARLLAATPDFGWLSEETAREDAMQHKQNVWVVDPIDGTSAFLSGSDHWCVGACLLSQGRPVAAAAFAPAQDRFYDAVSGGGARLNGNIVRVSHKSKLDGSMFVAHKSAISRNKWKSPVPQINCAMTTSLILRQCVVASGEFDGAIAFGKKHDWDLAPGDLIVHEAGGCTLDLDGRPFIYNRSSTRQNGLMAGSKALLDEIGERLHTVAA